MAQVSSRGIVPFCIRAGAVTSLAAIAYTSVSANLIPPDCTPALFSPRTDAQLDNGRGDGRDSIDWDFDWSDCAGATSYQLYVIVRGAPYPVYPVINTEIEASFFHFGCAGCYIIDANRLDWVWRVRAKVNDQWGEWSEERKFSVEPLDTDRIVRCYGLPATIVGTKGPDRIVGTLKRDVINGLDGDDVIYGLGGNDVICGGDGHDKLFGGNNNPVGKEVLLGGPGNDWIYGGKGRDELLGGVGDDVLFGQEGDDLLRGDRGSDKLEGGAGYDICDGGPDTTHDYVNPSCEDLANIP